MRTSPSLASWTGILCLAALGAVVFAGGGLTAVVSRGEQARVIPAPAADERPGSASRAVAVLAGGCFWGVQGVFQHVTGVTSAVSGYAGGTKETATYERVTTGRTGHAESVQVTYDPRQVSFGKLLQIYFSVAHDPTTLDRQGPDIGPQYRSAIFPLDDDQARLAHAYIAQLNAARAFRAPIVTKIETGQTFYAAEDYHQDYLTLHPNEPYIAIHDLPKIANLKRLFGDVFRSTPVLVGQKR